MAIGKVSKDPVAPAKTEKNGAGKSPLSLKDRKMQKPVRSDRSDYEAAKPKPPPDQKVGNTGLRPTKFRVEMFGEGYLVGIGETNNLMEAKCAVMKLGPGHCVLKKSVLKGKEIVVTYYVTKTTIPSSGEQIKLGFHVAAGKCWLEVIYVNSLGE